MRRNDREITDITQIEVFIAKEKIIRIAFCDGDDIYIVTDDGTTYAAGRLTEAEAEELHSIVNN